MKDVTLRKNQSSLIDLNEKEMRSIEGGREWTVGRIVTTILGPPASIAYEMGYWLGRLY